MSDDRATDELTALLIADLKVSSATTVGEAKAALVESILSLMSEPRAEVIEPTEAEKRERRTTMRLHWPQLPG